MLDKLNNFVRSFVNIYLLAMLPVYFGVLYVMPVDSPWKAVFGYFFLPVAFVVIRFIDTLDFSSRYLESTLIGLHIPFLLGAMFISVEATTAVAISAFATYVLTKLGLPQYIFSKIFR